VYTHAVRLETCFGHYFFTDAFYLNLKFAKFIIDYCNYCITVYIVYKNTHVCVMCMNFYLFSETPKMTFCCCYIGIIFGRYDARFRSHHKLCLSILKRFGFGQRVMETRILMEVEEMISKVRQQQGRAFDVKQLATSCVVNVVLSMLFGRRFDHSDPALQQLIADFNVLTNNVSVVLEIFPTLRFLPYFKNAVAEDLRRAKSVYGFINNKTAACLKVCNNIDFVKLCIGV